METTNKTLSVWQTLLLQKPMPTTEGVRDAHYIERLNEVFGIGSWQMEVDSLNSGIRTTFTIPAYGIRYQDVLDPIECIARFSLYLGINLHIEKDFTPDQAEKEFYRLLEPHLNMLIAGVKLTTSGRELHTILSGVPDVILAHKKLSTAIADQLQYFENKVVSPPMDTPAPSKPAPQKAEPEPASTTGPDPNAITTRDGNPVDVGQYITKVHDADSANATLRWLRGKVTKENLKVIEAWIASLASKCDSLGLTYDTKTDRYEVKPLVSPV